MAELFGSMEKMDIQAERRKTQEAEEKAKEAEEKARSAAEEGKKAVKKAIKDTTEAGIKSLVETCQELGSSKKTVAVKISEKYILSLREAEEKVDLYWK